MHQRSSKHIAATNDNHDNPQRDRNHQYWRGNTEQPVSSYHNLQYEFALNYEHIPWCRTGRNNACEKAREGRSTHPKATA